jgi:exopolysaccharide biosynthesis polyprenyl glycosylphosphotransferase
MLREQDYIFRRANQAIDVGLALSSLVIAHHTAQHFLRPWVFPLLIQPSGLFTHWWVYPLFPLLLLSFQVYNGSYHSLEFRREGRTQLRNLLGVAEAMVATLLLSVFLYEEGIVSRALILGAGAWLAVLMGVKVALIQRWFLRVRRRGEGARRILLVGSGDPLREFVEQVKSHPVWGFEIAGVVSDREALRPGQSVAGIGVVARMSELGDYLDEHTVDEAIFIPDATPLSDFREHLQTCELMGLRARVVLNFHAKAMPLTRLQVDVFDETPLVTFSPSWEVTDWRLLVKYGLDRVAAGAALLALSPLFLSIMAAIRLTSPRGAPIFFGQVRSGLNGRTFRCWKFRSMHMDAEARLAELKAQNEMTGPVFKMKNDPRITAVGRVLRKTSLDELPQLWNVLVGEMSLVGPRPPIPAEVAEYDRWQRRRLSMKPGITCLWQVSGRNLLDFETWMRLDLEYIDHWSLWLDFKILVRTVWVVLTGYGAM